jgi:hypothetical protein
MPIEFWLLVTLAIGVLIGIGIERLPGEVNHEAHSRTGNVFPRHTR